MCVFLSYQKKLKGVNQIKLSENLSRLDEKVYFDYIINTL